MQSPQYQCCNLQMSDPHTKDITDVFNDFSEIIVLLTVDSNSETEQCMSVAVGNAHPADKDRFQLQFKQSKVRLNFKAKIGNSC